MICNGSAKITTVSDYAVLVKKTYCEKCKTTIKISFPNKEKPNQAKFVRHSTKMSIKND